MTATPPLGRRVLVVGIGVVVLVLALVDTFVYLELRASLDRSLDELLADRAAIARAEGARLPPEQLAERLQENGLRAVVRAGDGTEYRADPPSPVLGGNVPPTTGESAVVTRTVPLPDGGEVTVFARTAGRDATLRQLLVLEAVGSLVAIALAGVLFQRTSRLALRPLAQITAAARRTALGSEGERLRPDRPETELGTMATAYDAMLDALEAAVREARAAEERSAMLAGDLSRALDDLHAAAEEARRSEEATRRFLADAAHQLRTPVAGIRACAETLLRGGSPEERDRLLATMVRETSRAGRLVTSLLQMARLDQGEPLVASDVDVAALLADEVDRVDLLAPALDVALSVEAGAPGRWHLPGAALREIVSNLLDNARRHARRRIDVVLSRRDGELVVTVVDDGPGVALRDRERIFDRFVTLDGRGGSGLGLAVARGTARAMGGDVRYDDGFVVSVPATAAPEPFAPDRVRDGARRRRG
jgi:two-component system OmpR family sensor kinase